MEKTRRNLNRKLAKLENFCIGRSPEDPIERQTCLFSHFLRRFPSEFRQFWIVFDPKDRIPRFPSLLASLSGGTSSPPALYDGQHEL